MSSCASGDLTELLRQAKEKYFSSLFNLWCGVLAMPSAAPVDLLEEGLVQSAVIAETPAHVQEQWQRSIGQAAAVWNVVCLAAPKDLFLLPHKHLPTCAECTKTDLTSSSQPQCPVCRYNGWQITFTAV